MFLMRLLKTKHHQVEPLILLLQLLHIVAYLLICVL
jgi:hypothetical protein